MNSKITYSLLAGAVGLSVVYILTGDDAKKLETDDTDRVSIINTSRQESSRTALDTVAHENSAIENKLLQITDSLRDVQNNLNRFKQSLDHEMEALKESVRTLEAGYPTSDYDSALSEGDIVDNDEMDMEREASATAWYDDQVSAIEAVLREEQTDQQWTYETEQRFASVFSQQENSIELHDMSCGDSICRVDAGFLYEESNTGPDIDHLIYGDIEWEGQMFSKVNADTGEITIYLIRPGMEMPVADSEG